MIDRNGMHAMRAAPVGQDDDWDMPEAVVSYAVRVWHNGFQDRLVGLWKNSRTHALLADGRWQYETAPLLPQVRAAATRHVCGTAAPPHNTHTLVTCNMQCSKYMLR